MPVFRFVDGVTAHDHGECEAPTIMEAYEELFGEPTPCSAPNYVGKYFTEFGAEGRYNECEGTHVYLGKRYLRTIHYILVREKDEKSMQTTEPSG